MFNPVMKRAACSLGIVLVAGAAGSSLAQPAARVTYTNYELITEPDQGLTPIYDLIQSATKTIDMTMYELTDTTAEQLLVQEAADGIKVRVILDQNLEKSNNTAAYNYLSENGVSVVWANTKYAATHQKTITIDDATSAIMTLNLTSQYYSTSRDFAVIDTTASDVAAIEAVFNKDFTASSVTPGAGADLIWSPTTSQTDLDNLIYSAQHTIILENEEMSSSNIVKELKEALDYGVQVKIIMTADSDYDSELNELQEYGAQIVTYAEDASLYIHAKTILVDYGYSDQVAFIGSQNFSNASLTENRELGLTTTLSSTLSSLNSTLQSDFAGGTPY